METQKQVRKLPRDVYEALHLSALASKGIGKDVFETRGVGPVCGIGHARWVEALVDNYDGEVERTLKNVNISIGTNDFAVSSYNRKMGRPHNKHLTFEEWCSELNVIPVD